MKNIKTGGRQKGTPNKKTMNLEQLIQKKYPNFNPILSMVELGVSEFTPIEMRFQCLKEIAAYLYPKRKPIELIERDEELKDNKIQVTFVTAKANQEYENNNQQLITV